MPSLCTRCEERYGPDNVIAVRRDQIYFVFRVLIPFIVRVLILLVGLRLIYDPLSGGDLFVEMLRYIVWWLIWLFTLYVWSKMISKMIDYYMDFTIITPRQIISYDQSGIFHRTTRSLDVDKLKSIRIDKTGIWCSLFNYGSIVFLSEGDTQSLWEIRLNYMASPNRLRDSIEQVIEVASIYKWG